MPIDRMLQFFVDDRNDSVIEAINAIARRVAEKYPMNPERTVLLRKLLEARAQAIYTLDYEEPK